MTQIPLSLYIHIPWCERKCPYCDFNSHTARAQLDEQGYVNALLHDLRNDIDQHGDLIAGRTIQSVFIGGGTPSLFSSTSYQRLFDGLKHQLNFAKHVEVTLEANPGSSEAKKFIGFREAGINRLSIGVQSFNQPHLTALGRIHNPSEAKSAAKFARDAGFENFNLDLMFGLPEQTLEQAVEDLETAITLDPTHLSCYQLTIEPNTLFHHNPPVTPDDDALWEMQSALQATLKQAGYRQYEVSAYAKEERECQHNMNYWRFGDYIGIGAGAHGKLSNGNQIIRSWKIKHPTSYLNKDNKLGSVETVAPQQIPFEFMMNTLRLTDGFSIAQFEARTGMSIDSIKPLLHKHQENQLIVVDSQTVRPTPFGHNMLNAMLEDYLEFQS